MLSFPDAIRTFYRRYTDFGGRSQRSEYWWFMLYFYGVAIVLGGVLGGLLGGFGDASSPMVSIPLGLWFLGHLVGLIALAVRRFHDLGQTGWLVLVFGLVSLIPLIGTLAALGQLIWFALPGNQGPNKYGPDPLQGNQADIFS